MIRTANIEESNAILELINFHAQDDQMLFRSLEEIQSHIGDFLVYVAEDEIVGTCSLSWNMGGMVEIRSLAVRPDFYRQGVGTALVEQCIKRAMLAEVPRIFVLTYAVPLFKKLGFRIINMSELPQKIWKDCQGCRKQDQCDETAMIRDLVPVVGQSLPSPDQQDSQSIVPV